MMVKRRINEDFKHVWAINWNGLPEDFSDVTEIVLTASVHRKKTILERGIDYVIEGNRIIVDFTPRFVTVVGNYNLELKYIKPSDGFIDGERRSAVDIDVVQIVSKSSQVTATGDITSTSEAMTGFQGLSAYEVWLKDNPDKTKEEYYNWLRQPATDAVSLIDDKIEHLDEVIDSSTENEAERVTAETLRLQSEEIRISAETERKANEVERLANEASRASDELIRKENESSREQGEATRKTNENERETAETTRISNENNRVTAEQERVQAESLRVTAESSRELAESLRVEAELLRQSSTQEAISNAETATENANTAAQNADDAREAIQSDLGAKAFHGYGEGEEPKTLKEVEDDTINTTEKPTAQSLSELNARITALEAIISNKIKDRIDVTKEFNVWGKTNLILYGDGASSKTPDFIGQTYIDTTNGNVYIAVGTSNAGNWKLV
jgi:hypothetical protein